MLVHSIRKGGRLILDLHELSLHLDVNFVELVQLEEESADDGLVVLRLLH